jgi:outer membrane protein OmpA-like peptidoglycan-associated protein
MKTAIHAIGVAACLLLLAIASAMPSCAQDGKLVVHVTPHQAYIFVDGHAISEASKQGSMSLSAGDHKIDFANYGYTSASRTITITSGQTSDVEVTLAPISSMVAGPFGAMTIEGASHDAVLLNGKTPDFFVGNGDEFDHEWGWKQELVVPPGNYQVTVLHGDKDAWSGAVDVPANQRVVVDVPKGVRKTVAWPRGEKFTSVPRFAVGTASATVAVAKPSAELSVTAAQINCGDSSQLKWTSSDAPHVEINPVGPVSAAGEQAVQPKQTTTYELSAVGPGGTTTSNATVNVNTAVQANLAVSPAEIQYKRVGEKVVQEGTTALNWTAGNASTASIEPLGTVSPNGNKTLQITPRKTDPGPIDESVTYTLSASNDCGGTDTQTATLHITGSIEPPPELVMRSIYFPTDLPTAEDAKSGLVASEQETLKTIAEAFKRYLEITPGAHLSLYGHADKRGPGEYNQKLSERRVQLVESFLTEQGVPADVLETQAYGDEQNLTAADVKQLMEQSPDLTEESRSEMLWRLKTIVLANNRRVDITLTATAQQSLRQYPYKAADFARLIDRNGPKASGVELAAQREKVAN